MSFRKFCLRSLAAAATLAALSAPAVAAPEDGCEGIAIPAGLGATRSATVPGPVAEAIWAWVAMRTGVDVALGPPPVCVLPQERLVAMRVEELGVSGPLDLVATYHRREGRMFLAAPWDPGSPVDLSVLAHEMVHHAQSVAGERFACPQEAEAEAYALQDEWLGAFGSGLQEEYQIDAMTRLVLTVCGL